MPNKVTLTPYFESRYKRLSKKFLSLEKELEALIYNLAETPSTGEPLGAGLYKIRLAVKSKGKSSGFRVITYLLAETEDGTDVYPITIYDKSEERTIKKDVLLNLIKAIFNE